MNRLIGFVLAVVVVLVLAIGAISAVVIVRGGGGDEGEGQRPEATEATTEEGGEGDGGAVEGQLRMPGGDPITMDPALAADAESANYIVEVFGGLVAIDPDLKIVPDIASELPTHENGGILDNPDGTVTYTNIPPRGRH